MCTWVWSVLLRVGWVLLSLAICVYAQAGDVTGQMEQVLWYTGVNPATDDIARMAELWTKAQKPEASSEERKLAFRDMYVLYSKLHGRDFTNRPQALDGLAQFVVNNYEAGARMDLKLPEPRGRPAGKYLHVQTVGRGPTPLLLISDLGVDGRKLYASFVGRNAAAYTMHIVTLPGAGAARMLPWPERLDYASRPWLNHIESELLALLDRPQWRGVTVVGSAAGGYFAARLALLRPMQVRAAVLVDALVNSPMRAIADPDAPTPMADRLARLKSIPPAPQLFPTAPVPPDDELRRLIADPQSRHPLAQNWMAFAVKDSAISREWTFDALSTDFFVRGGSYGFELLSTDLTEEIKKLEVPMLAMGTFHDEGSPRQSPPSLSQWDEMKLLYPQIPLTVVAFEDARSYLSADAPEEFDRALADFLAGREVRGKLGYNQPRTSPRAAVMQSVAGAEIRIAYGRPAVKEREIWGKLVPYNRVWRAGANEATTITINRDARIGGHTLPAGAYSLFVIPAEGEWTIIFNRIARQWGAFNYNPAFDALRFKAAAADGTHEEWLSYRIDAAEKDTAEVTLAWGGKRLAFVVEFASQGSNP